MASADGRRRGDWISYGISQSTATATTPTTLLRSAAHVAQGLAACGCPLALALPVSDLRGPAGTARLGELVRTYFALGGSHLHVNAVTAAELREAQAAPEAHASLVVRVSGYSARFVTVDRRWQDALVARAEAGL
jgi:formate C-acetyltransferase